MKTINKTLHYDYLQQRKKAAPIGRIFASDL